MHIYLLESFKEKDKIIKELRTIKHIRIFEFLIDDLLELIFNAPKNWIDKIKVEIPNVLVFKVNEPIDKTNLHHKNLSNSVTDGKHLSNLTKQLKNVIQKNKKQKNNQMIL